MGKSGVRCGALVEQAAAKRPVRVDTSLKLVARVGPIGTLVDVATGCAITAVASIAGAVVVVAVSRVGSIDRADGARAAVAKVTGATDAVVVVAVDVRRGEQAKADKGTTRTQ